MTRWTWRCKLCKGTEDGPGTINDGSVALHAHLRWRHPAVKS